MKEVYIVPDCHEPLTELYRDDHIVVVNKPSGLLSVPGKPPNDRDSALSRLQKINPETRVVHRLDMSTSGLMVFALNIESHRALSIQFQNREVEKEYIADVWGTLASPEGSVDLPLRCDWPNRPKQMVDFELGKPSLTHFHFLESKSDDIHRVLLKPVTGRSHQLRVHMAEIGHPIIGCEFYAHPAARYASERLHLHASRLLVYHPSTLERMGFVAQVSF
ncbi:pseudouridine synthase [uncultured Endozoicomonas sp.]|uniref:pseudouridine synthase n=1 Tax=uncultured Endozoicomonas sp. TaxID=432652 RepID=UPI002607F1D9|nr:pseudouridine synthase [uncultured Endozoicomonas sp.]